MATSDAKDKDKTKPAKRPLTRAGFTAMAKEHDDLLLIERPKVVAGIATAAAEGDRSENAEYIYGKKRLRELDKRLRYLGMLLKDVKVVDPDRLAGDRVCFGSTVVVLDEDGNEKRYTIVGEGEAEHHTGGISYQAPVARALMGKRVGDVVIAQRPAGEIELEVTGLFFGKRPWDTTAPVGSLETPPLNDPADEP